MGTLILVAGENGSGKSRCAENIVAQTTGRRYYIATMQPCSEENLRRVEKHRRQRRDLRFTTLELPHRVGAAAVENGSVMLLEDVSNLLANVMFERGGNEESVYGDIEALLPCSCRGNDHGAVRGRLRRRNGGLYPCAERLESKAACPCRGSVDDERRTAVCRKGRVE